MENVFEQLKQDEAEHIAFMDARRKEIEILKAKDKPQKKRESELREQAIKAQKFLGDPNFKHFEEYITDLMIETNIRMREIGLKNRPNEYIRDLDEVKRLAVMGEILARILKEPKDLVKLLK